MSRVGELADRVIELEAQLVAERAKREEAELERDEAKKTIFEAFRLLRAQDEAVDAERGGPLTICPGVDLPAVPRPEEKKT